MSLLNIAWSSDIATQMPRLNITAVENASQDLLPALRRFRLYMGRQTALTFKALGAKGSSNFRGVNWPWFADQYTRKTDGVTVPAQGGVPRLARLKEYKGTRGYQASLAGSRSTRNRSGRLHSEQGVPYAFSTSVVAGGFKAGRGDAHYFAPTFNPTQTAYYLAKMAHKDVRSTVGEKNVRGKLRPSGRRVTASSMVLLDTGDLLRRASTDFDISLEGPAEIEWGVHRSGVARLNNKRPFLFFEVPTDLEVAEVMILQHLLSKVG